MTSTSSDDIGREFTRHGSTDGGDCTHYYDVDAMLVEIVRLRGMVTRVERCVAPDVAVTYQTLGQFRNALHAALRGDA